MAVEQHAVASLELDRAIWEADLDTAFEYVQHLVAGMFGIAKVRIGAGFDEEDAKTPGIGRRHDDLQHSATIGVCGMAIASSRRTTLIASSTVDSPNRWLT